MIELVGNLQTYELGLTRIGKSGKSKSMALKAKSNDIEESSDDEDSKINSTSPGSSRRNRLLELLRKHGPSSR